MATAAGATTSAAASSSSFPDPITVPLQLSSSLPTNPNPRPPFHRPLHPIFVGKPINPSSAASRGGFPPRAAPDRVVTVANPAGYIRNSSPTAVMTLPQPQSHSRPAFLYASSAADHPLRPPASPSPSAPQPHQFLISRQLAPGSGGAHKAAPVVAAAAHPKVTPYPAVPPAPENNSNNRDKDMEDTTVILHDRKVRLSESSSGSLYALCRSWVRNGLPHETQPTIGDGLKLLPKPLPTSVANLLNQKKDENTLEDENSDKEDADSFAHMSSHDLLKRHVKHAKKVRARLRKERLLRIERYKHRLSLLLPTQSEVIGRSEVAPGS